MAAPREQVIQVNYQNPDPSTTLQVTVLVICNTPEDELESNIRINTARELPWLQEHPENSQAAIMVGGGPSVADHVDKIKELQSAGGVVFAMNAASQWLRKQGVEADYQCILDAKEDSAILVDQDAPAHIIASQVHPATMTACQRPVVWHLELGEIEKLFPPERVKQGVGGIDTNGLPVLIAVLNDGYKLPLLTLWQSVALGVLIKRLGLE